MIASKKKNLMESISIESLCFKNTLLGIFIFIC